MATRETFRISSHLKDIIGRDLVTNEFVAIFELVKNSFDAGATRVDIEFDPAERTIMIVDDGQGMSATDIKDKWLFVA
jgi:DNA mismatch repair ATPase MutL